MLPMRLRPRLGDLLIGACALLLAFAVAHRANTLTADRAQASADKALFSRYVQKLPGSFGAARIRSGQTADVVGARKRPDGRVCLLIHHGTSQARFVHTPPGKAPQWPRREA
jgi:hypothetical protein